MPGISSDGQPPPQTVPCRAPRVAVAIMCLTVGLVYGSGTVLFSALSTVAEELNASQTQLQWITGAYPLVIAALLLPGGAFVDRVGRKVGAVLGLSITSMFFLLASQTTDPSLVILCMGLAGIGGAIAFPATLATITAILPPERRGPAVGLWSVSLLMGGIIGTTVGGVMSEYLDWQWLLIVPAAIGFLLALPAVVFVPESRDPAHSHFDLRGAVLAALAVGLFVYGMTEAPTKGWLHPLTQTALIGVAFGVVFVWTQLVARQPMLEVRLFLDGRFGSGSLVNLLSWFLAYGYFFTAVQYRAYTLGYDPLMVGVSFGPAAVLAVPLALAGPRLASRYGARPVMVGGLGMLAGGAIAVAWGANAEVYWPVVTAEGVMMGGLALLGGPATESIIDALPPAKHGVASAVNDITRQLGVALGVAMLGSLFNAAYRAHIAADSSGLPDDLVGKSQDSAADGLDLADSLVGDLASAQTAVVEHAVAIGFMVAMIAAALVVIVAAVAVWRWCPADAGKVPVQAPAMTPAMAPAMTPAMAPATAPQARALPARILDLPPVRLDLPGAPAGELVQAAMRLEQLIRAAEDREADLRSRIAALQAQEAELHLRWNRVSDYVTEVELQGLFAPDPIAAPCSGAHR